MKTPLDEYHERRGMSAKPHEHQPRGAGNSCAHCAFSPGHPVHHHKAAVIDLASRRKR